MRPASVSVGVEQRNVNTTLRATSDVELDNRHPVAERTQHCLEPPQNQLEVVDERHSQHLSH